MDEWKRIVAKHSARVSGDDLSIDTAEKEHLSLETMDDFMTTKYRVSRRPSVGLTTSTLQ